MCLQVRVGVEMSTRGTGAGIGVWMSIIVCEGLIGGNSEGGDGNNLSCERPYWNSCNLACFLYRVFTLSAQCPPDLCLVPPYLGLILMSLL